MPKVIDIAGQKYGHWTVLRFHSVKRHRQPYWECQCVCGTERVIRGGNLKTGQSKSCGCNGGVAKYWRQKSPTSAVCKVCEAEKIVTEFPISFGRYQPVCIECIGNRKTYRKLFKAKYSRVRSERDKEIRLDSLKRYGGACKCCGEETTVFLAIDHIKGGGSQHLKQIARTRVRRIGTWLQENNYPDGFQVLCTNCNWAKHRSEICPHQIDRAVAALSLGC